MKFFGRKDRERRGPEGLWHTCCDCGEMAYAREFEMAHKVCPKCGFHERMSAPERIALLIDEPDKFEELAPRMETTDPLQFERDGLRYQEHLARYQKSSGLTEAVVCGMGRLNGAEICLAVIDFRFLGAAMGVVVGEKITLTIEAAVERRLPLVLVNCSGGARMQEGMLSLMQMAKTTAALRRLHDEGLLYVSVMTDPTLAGVTASFASLADVIVAEPGATVGFTGRRLIEQIVKQKLPDDAQSAEFMQQRGMIDLVTQRRALKELLTRLIDLYTGVERSAPEADLDGQEATAREQRRAEETS